jgi:soluble lytic murein transglycosylase-like protein
MVLVLSGFTPWIASGVTTSVKASTVEDIDAALGEETLQIIEDVADEWGVCPELLEAICYVESGGNQYCVSDAGAIGLFQIMAKYSEYSKEELYDKRTSAEECCRILFENMEVLETEDLDVILTSYNTGAYSKTTKKALNGSGGNSYAKKVMKYSSWLQEIHGKFDYNFVDDDKAVG